MEMQTKELRKAAEFGTPLYVFHEEELREITSSGLYFLHLLELKAQNIIYLQYQNLYLLFLDCYL